MSKSKYDHIDSWIVKRIDERFPFCCFKDINIDWFEVSEWLRMNPLSMLIAQGSE